ncbi:hypothetical protein B0T22DRAFT_288506 [Podospora appendiculata]|uniref:Uncharacterized protein n=1 Tax=Podospora appendiculata TaxID=314037 RepID=A0AAE0X114_9PEZI|nr:hypothetical protein B0T22DRAFT_288506 [Podospora appendiculata]
MAPSKSAKNARTQIRRFSLQSISINDAMNGYKTPQMVLKTQVDPAPRMPYTGSRTRTPVLRHLLMIHVKDKADELVKLDLDIFAASSKSRDGPSQYTVDCVTSDRSITFRYPKGEEKRGQQSLKITFNDPSDLNSVLGELAESGLEVKRILKSHGFGIPHKQTTLRYWAVPGNNPLPVPAHQSTDYRELYHEGPPLPTPPSSQGQHTPYQGNYIFHQVANPPLSLPVGHTGNLPLSWPSWSLPPRPATTIGIPGMIGEGIYKISRVGPRPASRTKMRKLPVIPESQDSTPNTPSGHLDTSLRPHASRKRSLQDEGVSSSQENKRASNMAILNRHADLVSRLSSTENGNERERPERSSRLHALESLSSTTDHSATYPRSHQQLRSHSDLVPAFTYTTSTMPSTKTASVPKRLLSARRMLPSLRGECDNQYSSQCGEVLASTSMDSGTWTNDAAVEHQDKHDISEDWLLQLSVIQQGGLAEATRIWDELMTRGQKETESIINLDKACKVWSSHRQEWEQRLNSVASDTVQKMRRVKLEGKAI